MRTINLKGMLALGALFASATLLSFRISDEMNAEKSAKQSSLYWYNVNTSTNQTIGTAAFHDTKTNVVAAQDCKDDAGQPMCLFGSTNPNLPNGTDIGEPSPSNRILQTQP